MGWQIPRTNTERDKMSAGDASVQESAKLALIGFRERPGYYVGRSCTATQRLLLSAAFFHCFIVFFSARVVA